MELFMVIYLLGLVGQEGLTRSPRVSEGWIGFYCSASVK